MAPFPLASRPSTKSAEEKMSGSTPQSPLPSSTTWVQPATEIRGNTLELKHANTTKDAKKTGQENYQ
ncbi:hypothetical protein BGX34_005769, partial [Mortierella sp. NVP85]